MSETATRLVVTIPGVPASCLLPNAQRRTHYRVWAPEAAALRSQAATLAFQVRRPFERDYPSNVEVQGPFRISCTIAWPKGRQRCDYQAAVHALKATVDGLGDGGWFADDKQLVGMDVEQVRAEPDDRAGWVRVELRSADDIIISA